MKTSTLTLTVVLFLAILIGYMFIEPYWVETKSYTISSNQIPPDFDGKMIVYLSDIHASPYYSEERVNNLVNQVNAMNPDIVLLGGDYVSGDNSYVNATIESLSHLHAPLGIYAVLGNTDPQDYTYWAFKNTTTIINVNNLGDWVGNNDEKIRIGGLGPENDWQNPEAAIGNATPSDFVILLKHEPDYFDKINKSQVDLVLSGHTHGGQVTFFGIWAPLLPANGKKYVSGVYKKSNSTLIVGNGIGTTMLPLRFFARPQIVIITLHRT